MPNGEGRRRIQMSVIPCKDIKLLVQLQDKDKTLDDLRAQLEAVPGRTQALLDALEEKKSLLSAEKETLTTLQVTKKEKEIELTGKEELIRKHQVTLNQIKSNEAFKALLSELETAKKEQDELETKILETLDEVDTAFKKQKKTSQALKELEVKTQKDISELEAKKDSLETGIKSLESDRTAFCSQIDPDASSNYEHIRTQKKGLSVTAVKKRNDKGGGSSCGGCNISLTPQCLVDLKKKDVIIICDNCQRIIYSGEDIDTGTPVNAQSGEATP